MASAFQLQIVHLPTGRVAVAWPPGDAQETAAIDEVCQRVAAEGVGLGRTEAHVVADVRRVLETLLYALKARVHP